MQTTSSTPERLIPPTGLFRFEIPCQSIETVWEPSGKCELDDRFQIPDLGRLDGGGSFADVRIGWSRKGFAISLVVSGKKQMPWCRQSRLESSDGLALWLSTRETDNIHRANRFCHQFVLLPCGRGQRLDQPIAQHVMIQRALENSKTLPAGALQIRSTRRKDGYAIRAAIPAVALTGFDPDEHRRLGFFFAVMDQELGWHMLTLSPEYPVASDPSLWCTLQLV